MAFSAWAFIVEFSDFEAVGIKICSYFFFCGLTAHLDEIWPD
jgi:hypothetical protein